MNASSSKPAASLSLDLDNQWSYMKTRGDDTWVDYPSYLDLVVPRFLQFFAERRLTITVFVVGQDAVREENHRALRSITDAGHEIGNHSFRHEPWLHLYTADELAREIADAEDAIAKATGQRPRGFRGPGFSLSRETLEVLQRRGYRYDASTFPTFIGPLARAYYFFTARLSQDQQEQRKELFGGIKDGLRPLGPYRWQLGDSRAMLELPVTTMPVFRLPFHVSYLIYLARFSPGLARLYFRLALELCRLTRTEPSLLLHPLDFLGSDDGLAPLAFFPGMDVALERKLAWLDGFIADFSKRFEVLPMGRHVDAIESGGTLPTRQPQFAGDALAVGAPS
ncbi:MAG: polysaccharide deacetylase family protein [Rhodospirillales bacterium]